MELKKTYFFDTYAFFEIINGNQNYMKYKGMQAATTRLNLMELHYGLWKDYGKEFADQKYDEFLPICMEIDDYTIKKANEFKLLHRKKNLSYIDCIGYIMAKIHGMAFLTGDRQLIAMENVEFVK